MHSKLQTQRGSALPNSGKGIVSHAPFLSREAALTHGVTGTGRRDTNPLTLGPSRGVTPSNMELARGGRNAFA